ncbi:MAG TPA: haloacid dehalogenase [Thermomicrobiales bacterium]|nr:haloacid dehalogenase [Thermomicrobiales bacterium]
MTQPESRHDDANTAGSSAAALSTTIDGIIGRFESVNAARDHAITTGRQVIRLAANTVRALHRGDHESAATLLDEASVLLAEIRATTAPYPALYWAGYVQDAMKEYAEAAITANLLADRLLPSPDALKVEDAAWLNALAEAGSELRRAVLDRLRADRHMEGERLLTRMDEIYAVLVTVDFPDAITGGLRRTTDQFRAVLERTRGDVTVAVRQHRLELALRSVDERLRSAQSNG